MPVDTEIRSLAAALGHPPPIPKHALATLRDTMDPADIATLHLGHTPDGDTVTVIATTADRVIITLNRPRTCEPLHDVALADLDACVAVTTSPTEPSTLVLVPTDPTAPLIVTEMPRHQAGRACAAIRRAMPPTPGDQRAGHWSAALPADLSVVVAGRLLNDPTRPVTAPHRVAAAVTSTGVVLVHRHHGRQGRRGPRASFVRWASVDTVDIDTVHPHPARPAPPTRVRRVTTTSTAPSGVVLRLGTPTGNWVIEAKSVQPSTLRADLATVLLSAPTAAPHDPDGDPGGGDEMTGFDAFPATTGPLTAR